MTLGPNKRDVAAKAVEAGGVSNLIPALRAHFWKALIVGLLAGGGTAWALFRQVPVYEARDVLLVQLGRDYAFVPDAPVTGLRTPDPGDLETYVNAEIQLLSSSRVKEAALDHLIDTGVMKIGPESNRAQLMDELGDAVSINLITGSYLLDVRARSQNADQAKKIAEAVADAYLDLRGAMIGADSADFLKGQIAQVTQRIKEIDKAMLAIGWPSLDMYQQRVAALAGRKLASESDLSANIAAIAGLEAKLDRLKAMLGVTTAGPFTSQDSRLSIMRVEADADLATATASAKLLRETTTALTQEIAKIEPLASDLEALEAERDALLATNTQLHNQLAAADLATARNAAGLGMVRVIEKGLLRTEPVGLPDRIKAIASVLVGLLAALIVIPLFAMGSDRTRQAAVRSTEPDVPELAEAVRRSRTAAAGKGGLLGPASRK